MEVKDDSAVPLEEAKIWFAIKFEFVKSTLWPTLYPFKRGEYHRALKNSPFVVKNLKEETRYGILMWQELAFVAVEKYFDFYKPR